MPKSKSVPIEAQVSEAKAAKQIARAFASIEAKYNPKSSWNNFFKAIGEITKRSAANLFNRLVYGRSNVEQLIYLLQLIGKDKIIASIKKEYDNKTNKPDKNNRSKTLEFLYCLNKNYDKIFSDLDLRIHSTTARELKILINRIFREYGYLPPNIIIENNKYVRQSSANNTYYPEKIGSSNISKTKNNNARNKLKKQTRNSRIYYLTLLAALFIATADGLSTAAAYVQPYYYSMLGTTGLAAVFFMSFFVNFNAYFSAYSIFKNLLFKDKFKQNFITNSIKLVLSLCAGITFGLLVYGSMNPYHYIVGIASLLIVIPVYSGILMFIMNITFNKELITSLQNYFKTRFIEPINNLVKDLRISNKGLLSLAINMSKLGFNICFTVLITLLAISVAESSGFIFYIVTKNAAKTLVDFSNPLIQTGFNVISALGHICISTLFIRNVAGFCNSIGAYLSMYSLFPNKYYNNSNTKEDTQQAVVDLTTPVSTKVASTNNFRAQTELAAKLINPFMFIMLVVTACTTGMGFWGAAIPDLLVFNSINIISFGLFSSSIYLFRAAIPMAVVSNAMAVYQGICGASYAAPLPASVLTGLGAGDASSGSEMAEQRRETGEASAQLSDTRVASSGSGKAGLRQRRG